MRAVGMTPTGELAMLMFLVSCSTGRGPLARICLSVWAWSSVLGDEIASGDENSSDESGSTSSESASDNEDRVPESVGVACLRLHS